MKVNKTKTIVICLAALALFSTARYAYLYQQAKNKLSEMTLAVQEKASQQASPIFDHIDRMIVSGKYDQAIAESKVMLKSVDVLEKDPLHFRIAIAGQLLQLSRQASEEVILEKTKVDTVEKLVIQSVVPEVDVVDSMTFALEKAHTQVDILKRQLKQKVSGAYLTFQTKKGNSLHYVGKTRNGKANGFGIAILDSGSRYEGEWSNNMRHGSGEFYWADGQHYEGNYENDQRSGSGTYFWPNGDKYVGQWTNDMRNGEGSFYDKKGKVIASGTWKDDKLDEKDKKKKSSK